MGKTLILANVVTPVVRRWESMIMHGVTGARTKEGHGSDSLRERSRSTSPDRHVTGDVAGPGPRDIFLESTSGRRPPVSLTRLR